MELKKDLQGETHGFAKFPLNKVGIVNVVKRVDIVRGAYKYSFTPSISALIDLPAEQRGIHMSRSAETIEQVINEVVFSPTKSVEELGKRMVKLLIERHSYAQYAEVEMEGVLIVQRRENDGEHAQKAYNLYGKAVARRLDDSKVKYRLFVGASADGMTACPCALEMSRSYAKELMQSRRDLGMTSEQIETLLNILPFSSHNQRATGWVIIEVGEDPIESVDMVDLVEIIEGSMSSRIKSVLKRPQEASVVRIAHLNPLFAEDVVRTIATRLAGEKFDGLADENEVVIKIDSMESIHAHDVHAEMTSTFGELRAIARNPDNS
ncbi:MAG: GTP cyclohydrolase MptA [Promethearchaeota archaeon]